MSWRDKQQEAGRGEPKLGRVVLEDLRRTDLRRTFRRDLKELYSFYLTDERREQLASMGTVKGIFWFWGWLFKSLLMKLSPSRRLALLAALILLAAGQWQIRSQEVQIDISLRSISVVILFLILMLELKDKLLAHDEIEIARQVQLALLPRRHPEPPGWSIWSQTRPANNVGGDLIDYIDLEDRRLAVALGDVAGKGLGAALLMAKLQATLRATAPESPSLADLGSRLNAILLRDGIDNRFATLFYLVLEPASGRIGYLNAGHNPPYLLRATRGGEGVESLKASSPPLGMIPGARFSGTDIELDRGDLLVIYSDGLTEANNTREEEFGAERLRSLMPSLKGLRADEAGARIVREVEAFMGEARPHDDLSLVVLARATFFESEGGGRA
jgi:phosphoserine phosphatase RsbU/P